MRKLFETLAAACLALALLPMTALAGEGSAPVSYVGEDGAAKTCETYTTVTGATKDLSDGWYVVSGDVTTNEEMRIIGDANLILCDGATLTVEAPEGVGYPSFCACTVDGGASLTVYGQAGGTGTLSVTGKDDAGIRNSGALTVYGGRVKAASDLYGDSGAGLWNSGTLTVYGGSLEAKGTLRISNHMSAHGIGNSGTLTVCGGTLTATGRVVEGAFGADRAMGIRNYNELTVLGGTVEATGDDFGIWNFIYDTAQERSTLTVLGGTVTAAASKTDGKAVQADEGSALSLPDSYKWRTAEGGAFTQHICTLAHYAPGGEAYAQIVVPGDVPYHDFGAWIDEAPATCTDDGAKGHKDCARCGGHFDADGAEIADLTIKATGHVQESEWRYDQKGHWEFYPCCDGETAKTAHGFGADGECACGAVRYIVTFDPNGGTVEPTDAATDVDGRLGSLPTPTREGYAFDGWFTEEAGGAEVTPDAAFAAHATVYAKWSDAAVPAEPEPSADDVLAKTGDDAHAAARAALLLAGACTMAATVARLRRRGGATAGRR